MQTTTNAINAAVIIVNYNGGVYLRDCLDALMRQTIKPLRLLVMDNNSTDSSVEACRVVFPAVEFHQLDDNHGFARANNLAVERCPECEWIVLINPDAFPTADWLEILSAASVKHPEYDMFACCMLSANQPDHVDDLGLAYNTSGVSWPRFRGSLLTDVELQPKEVFAPSGGAAMYRREAFVAAGGFDERFFCYYEDVDLGFRLRLYGHRCLFLPNAVVHHIGSALTGGQQSDFSIYHAHRNMIWTYFKNMPAGYLWRYLPMHILTNIAIIFLFIRKGRGRILAKAKWHGLLALRPILRERAKIMRLMKAKPHEVLETMDRGNGMTAIYRRLRKISKGQAIPA